MYVTCEGRGAYILNIFFVCNKCKCYVVDANMGDIDSNEQQNRTNNYNLDRTSSNSTSNSARFIIGLK